MSASVSIVHRIGQLCSIGRYSGVIVICDYVQLSQKHMRAEVPQMVNH